MSRALDVVGLMSGTSVDGIDATLVTTDGETLVRSGIGDTFAYRAETLEGIARAIDRGSDAATSRIALDSLERLIAEDHAAAVARLLEGTGRAPALLGFHGQTVFHDAVAGVSVQLGDAARLAALTGVDTVHDFRANDLARGGEGAPLAPVYQRAVLDALALPLPAVLLNIGGISNLGGAIDDRLIGFDCGPGNALMDDLMKARTGRACDEKGALALTGHADRAIVRAVLAEPFFARPPPRSLDRQAFARLPALGRLDALALPDALATLAAITVAAVARAVALLPALPRTLVIGGGGQHNRALLGGLERALACDVHRADDLGLPGDLLEAELMAFLAVRHLRELPLTFPETTGVDAACAGGRLATAGSPSSTPRPRTRSRFASSPSPRPASTPAVALVPTSIARRSDDAVSDD